MYRRPSTSKTCAPSPRAIGTGFPPTDRNDRTGLLTPPGNSPCAASRTSALSNVRDLAEDRIHVSLRAGEHRRVSQRVEARLPGFHAGLQGDETLRAIT